MTNFSLQLSLSFQGQDAEDHRLDFYDVSQALVGFQRSLAITTHLVLNDKVITQAPALKGAKILALPPQEGSWEIIAAVVAGIGYLGTRPRDTVIGHLVFSAYDYVVSNALGFHVNFDESLGQQYERLQGRDGALPILEETRFDSVIEKSETAIRDMHRPISKSETAAKAQISYIKRRERQPLSHDLNINTYNYIRETIRSKRPVDYSGRVSSYNINTYRGRIFVEDYNRPIPFELLPECRTTEVISRITQSLNSNALDRFHNQGSINFSAFVNESRNGRIKSFYVVMVTDD